MPDNIKKYLFKPISTSKVDFKKTILNHLTIIFHSLLPHSVPEFPPSKLSVEAIQNNHLDTIYESSLEIYKDSKERINTLENKAFNLMTYISAITAILFFLLDKEIIFLTKFLIILSIAILILALLISLRCIGIKTQKTLFIDSMFDFDQIQVKSKSKNDITIELINCTLYNQNVADNTTDILRATRSLLFIGIILATISFLSFTFKNNEDAKKSKIEITHSNYIDSISKQLHADKIIEIERLHQIEINIDELKNLKSTHNDKLDSVNLNH